MCPDDPLSDPTRLLTAAVERFLRATGMSPTAFGRCVANDPALVHDMRQGRELRRATRARIRAFISAEMAD